MQYKYLKVGNYFLEHTDTHTHIHIHIHTYIHTHMHTYILIHRIMLNTIIKRV